MNIKNLKIAIEVLGTIRENQLEMNMFITSIDGCNSVACVIGHCMLSDRFDFNFSTKKESMNQAINFSENIFDVDYASLEFQYMFSGSWTYYDNSINGAIKRIEKVINGFEPKLGDLPWS